MSRAAVDQFIQDNQMNCVAGGKTNLQVCQVTGSVSFNPILIPFGTFRGDLRPFRFSVAIEEVSPSRFDVVAVSIDPA